MKKYKVIHINTDYKFIAGFERFDSQNFDNTIVVFEQQVPYIGKYKDDAIIVKSTDDNAIKQIIDICKEADIVILYALDHLKAHIALLLPKDIIVIWRFFGMELYGKMQDYVATEKTKTYLTNGMNKYLYRTLKAAKNLARRIVRGKYKYYIIENTIKRCNYVMMLYRQEYDFLTSYWSNLPEFIQISYKELEGNYQLPDQNLKTTNNAPIIVIGNNKNYYNNHLDIIDIVESSSKKENYTFKLLMNYGTDNLYTEAIIKQIANKPYFELIDKFIEPDKFQSFYSEISAFVLNGRRQMAGGNIMFALRSGTKIYMNTGNSHYHFLIDEGFKVFTIEDFERDLEINNITLSIEEAKFNLEKYKEFTQKYNKEEFNRTILKVLDNKNNM